ncbi:hypothetical protein Neosp_000714 [[Neocosmospora] mangrovei]
MAEPKCNGDEHPPDAVQTHRITTTNTEGIMTADFEGNADEHHNAVQTLFDRTGGNEHHWTKALYGFLKVNDVAISTPMQKSMKLLTRPWKESLDVSFEFFGSPDDFGYTHLKLSARGCEGFGDEQVGSIMVWSKHMTEIKFEGEKETKSCNAAQLAIHPGSFSKLLVMGQDGLRMHAQLQSLRKTMDIDSEQHIGLYFPSRILEDINATSNIIRGQAKLDAKLDPLARFFTHAPVAKTLTIGQLPAPGEDGFPDTEVAARVLYFVTDRQYLLYNVAGAYYDEHLQWQSIAALKSEKMPAFFVSLPHMTRDRSFLCLIDPAGHECLTERDRLAYVNKEADLIFCRQMSQDELNDVVPNSTESNQPDRAKWIERVVAWALQHDDLFVKPDESSKAEPSDDDPRWFSAYRIEFLSV